MLRTRSFISRIFTAGLRRFACFLRSWGEEFKRGLCIFASELQVPRFARDDKAFWRCVATPAPRNPASDSPIPPLQGKKGIEVKGHAYKGFRVGGAVFAGHDSIRAVAAIGG